MKSTMKYPGAKNEIFIKNTRYLYEKYNEILLGLKMKYPLKVPDIYMKSTMKYPAGSE